MSLLDDVHCEGPVSLSSEPLSLAFHLPRSSIEGAREPPSLETGPKLMLYPEDWLPKLEFEFQGNWCPVERAVVRDQRTRV